MELTREIMAALALALCAVGVVLAVLVIRDRIRDGWQS
jgi:hypothetical protein